MQNKISNIVDLLRLSGDGKCKIVDWESFQQTNQDAVYEEFLSIKQAVNYTLQNRGINVSQINLTLPSRPIILSLINMSAKGCSKWTKLKKRTIVGPGVRKREEKWNESLGRIQGIYFWNSCYSNLALVNFDNRLKWFQFQINRGTLKTNRIVSKFAQDVNSMCSFCNVTEENILHLFWECRYAQNLINEVMAFFEINNPFYAIRYERRAFLFCVGGAPTEIKFILALHLKLFLWKCRCKKNMPTTNQFITYFSKEIQILQYAFPQLNLIDV
jgi:hypothetical protein